MEMKIKFFGLKIWSERWQEPSGGLNTMELRGCLYSHLRRRKEVKQQRNVFRSPQTHFRGHYLRIVHDAIHVLTPQFIICNLRDFWGVVRIRGIELVYLSPAVLLKLGQIPLKYRPKKLSVPTLY